MYNLTFNEHFSKTEWNLKNLYFFGGLCVLILWLTLFMLSSPLDLRDYKVLLSPDELSLEGTEIQWPALQRFYCKNI